MPPYQSCVNTLGTMKQWESASGVNARKHDYQQRSCSDARERVHTAVVVSVRHWYVAFVRMWWSRNRESLINGDFAVSYILHESIFGNFTPFEAVTFSIGIFHWLVYLGAGSNLIDNRLTEGYWSFSISIIPANNSIFVPLDGILLNIYEL